MSMSVESNAHNGTMNGNTNGHVNGNGNGHHFPMRVVITGVGAITPVGLSNSSTWESLLAGRSGIAQISRFDTSDLRTTFAGEVRDFDPANYMDRKEARRLDPYIQYALAATKEAIADAKIDLSNEDPMRVGVLVGSALGGAQT